MEDVLNLRKKDHDETPKNKEEVVVAPKIQKDIEPKHEPTPSLLSESDISLSWIVPARSKSKNHMIAGIVLIVAGFLFWLLMKDLLFGLVMVFSGGILAAGLTTKPEHKISITEEGISIDEHLNSFDDLESFDIVKLGDGSHELVINPQSKFKSLIRIPINEKDATKIASAMVAFIPEKTQEYSWSDLIASRLGF